MYTISTRCEFSSAHKLRGYKGKCESLHGHNWGVEMTVGSEKLDKLGMILDFTDLKRDLKAFLDKLDHKCLNEMHPFNKINPTSENIAKYIYDGMKGQYRKNKVNLLKVTVWETARNSAAYEA